MEGKTDTFLINLVFRYTETQNPLTLSEKTFSEFFDTLTDKNLSTASNRQKKNMKKFSCALTQIRPNRLNLWLLVHGVYPKCFI